VGAMDFAAVHLATRRVSSLHHGDMQTLVSQGNGTGQAAHAGTDDDHPLLRHGWAPRQTPSNRRGQWPRV
jgi:hypothetical protein